MKKILIGAILASSLAVGGDVMKCSHAVKEHIYWDDRANNFTSITDSYTEMVRSEAGYLRYMTQKIIIEQCKNVFPKDWYGSVVRNFKYVGDEYRDNNITFDY